MRSGKVRVDFGSIDRFTKSDVVLTNGKSAECDIAVFATGCRSTYHFLDEELHTLLAREDDGVWLYKNMLHPDIPGFAWVLSNTLSFTSPLTAALQAAWVGDALCGYMEVPEPAVMHAAVAGAKHRLRVRTPETPQRATLVMSGFFIYHDDLLRDRGIAPGRFGGLLGPVANLIVPADPQQYTECYLPAPKVPRRRRHAPRALRAGVAAIILVSMGVCGVHRRSARKRT